MRAREVPRSSGSTAAALKRLEQRVHVVPDVACDGGGDSAGEAGGSKAINPPSEDRVGISDQRLLWVAHFHGP